MKSLFKVRDEKEIIRFIEKSLNVTLTFTARTSSHFSGIAITACGCDGTAAAVATSTYRTSNKVFMSLLKRKICRYIT